MMVWLVVATDLFHGVVFNERLSRVQGSYIRYFNTITLLHGPNDTFMIMYRPIKFDRNLKLNPSISGLSDLIDSLYLAYLLGMSGGLSDKSNCLISQTVHRTVGILLIRAVVRWTVRPLIHHITK